MMRSNNKHLFILSCSWLIVNLLLYFSLGVKYAIDTARFDTEASAWLTGTFETSYHFWYSGYIAILALSRLLFSSIYPSILLQCIVSLTATLLFYTGLCRILKNERTAFIASGLTILYLPIQQWNVCLLTESFFISSILLFIWAYSLEDWRTKWISLYTIAIVATMLRPNGGILLIALFILTAREILSKQNRLYVYTIGLLLLTGILFLLNCATDVFYQFMADSFAKGEIICGYKGWIIPVGTPASVSTTEGSIVKILGLIIDQPLKSLQLGCCRFAALWTDVRMYYSSLHNIFISLLLLPAYIFAATGFMHYRKIHRGVFIFTIVYTGLNSVLVMITYADWDGRFLVPLLPVIFIWSALGIQKIFMRFRIFQ
ncbi:MAG: hypothetical protein ACTHJT_07620 [Cytophaga sp.]|uniref:hypothetical protein n=1 Tax=Cytophaga sp. TaxID=29535 RepID=UPI003F803F94